MKIVLILFLLIINIQNKGQSTLSLYTHTWCPPCKKVKSIFTKISANFPEIAFKIHQYSNKTVFYKSQKNRSSDLMPFPSIVFNCSDSRMSYQNDMTVSQLNYWINAICLHKLPTCSNNINKELFHISVLPQKDSLQLFQEMQKHPHIKICQANNANYTHKDAITILQQTANKTLFFDYFSNNVRNYLIQSGKLAVALITSNINTTKAASFFATYLSLQNYMDQKVQNETFKLIRYQMKQQHKEQLAFFGLCFNHNITKCVGNTERLEQISTSQKQIPKLLNFFNLQMQNVRQLQYIVAFRFNHPKFETYIYHQTLGILDQKFLFWIDQILTTTSSETVSQSHKCMWNSVVHRVSDKNLQDIQTHSFLVRQIEQLKLKYGNNKILVSKIQAVFHNEPKFTLCLADSLPISFESNKDILHILERIEEVLVEQKIISKSQADLDIEQL